MYSLSSRCGCLSGMVLVGAGAGVVGVTERGGGTGVSVGADGPTVAVASTAGVGVFAALAGVGVVSPPSAAGAVAGVSLGGTGPSQASATAANRAMDRAADSTFMCPPMAPAWRATAGFRDRVCQGHMPISSLMVIILRGATGLTGDGHYLYAGIRGRHGDRTIQRSTLLVEIHQFLGLVVIQPGKLEVHVNGIVHRYVLVYRDGLAIPGRLYGHVRPLQGHL